MKNQNTLITRLLSRYCLIEALASLFIDSGEKAALMSNMREVFCIKDSERLEKLTAILGGEPFIGMKNLVDYERECRIIEYMNLVGTPVDITEGDRIVLAAIGDALHKKQEISASGMSFTAATVKDKLLESASVGNVHAISTLALLEYYGIFIGKNTKRAEKNLGKAVMWNDVDSILLALSLYPEKREEYLLKLSAILSSDSELEMLEAVADYYGLSLPDGKDKRAALMERAFLVGSVKRDIYEEKFASFIYSGIIREEDKKKLISSYKKENAAIYDDLPTYIDESFTLSPDLSKIEQVTLSRDSEIRKIKRNLACVNTRRNKFYKPLLVISKDPYVISMYKQAVISAFSTTPCAKIDASVLGREELSATKENLFFRAVADSGKASTLVIIEDLCELSESGAKELARYVRGDMRAEFRLAYPQLTLDLSAALPVFFSEGEVASDLAELCDVVRAEPVVAREKQAVVYDILEYKRRSYGLGELSVSDDVLEVLVAKGSREITDLADELAKYVSISPECGKVQRELYESLVREMKPKTTKFGF